MCQSCNEGRERGGSGCCCSSALCLEDEIRMLDAMKTVQVIRLDSIDRKIASLKRQETREWTS